MKKTFWLSLSLACTAALGVALPAPAQQAAAPVASFDASVTNQGYRLRSGDQIRIDVLGFADLSREQTILPDGTINIMYVGAVRAAGRTPEDLSEHLRSQFTGILKKPVIAVSVTETRPLQVNVVGEVMRPGPQVFLPQTGTMAAGGTQGGLTRRVGVERISNAIALAGGVTHRADVRQVTLIRQLPDSDQKETVNLWEALQTGDFRRDLTLTDGDTIQVPALPADDKITEDMAQQVATSSLAPRTINVQVAGEVKRPGAVEIDPRSGLLNAISAAGGATNEANLEDISLARMLPNGRIERVALNLNKVSDGSQKIQVRNGDVVFVGRGGSFAAADQSRAFLGPLGDILRIFTFPFRFF
ncbi:polysaccharide biosynthesis/export family protein [Gloeobacter morelensis]|uniref:SLBB domain-containing protein n=1 Tax=Gloeobacter morelensis MG652769 TaxID=2781736 RepID=A0ABY3PS67_9CYAN|nr:polysaccharide biosynthesis/export family protein [Gloeobacter morelensis]UFP96568.1 SLBB domain-containing protein [Gloeobacter morelensis MG652769]